MPQYWAHCRWINPQDPRDLCLLSEKLSCAQRKHIELRQCSAERLQQVITRLRTLPADPSGEDSGSGSESDTQEAPATRSGGDAALRLLPPLSELGGPAQPQPASTPTADAPHGRGSSPRQTGWWQGDEV